MSQSNQKIDTHKVIATINENLAALKEGFDPAKLSETAREEILEEIIKLKELALKVKADLAKD